MDEFIGVTQTILHEEGAKVGGNCLQAAVATVFSLPIDAVPHFSQFTWWDMALRLWAAGQPPGWLTVKWTSENTAPEEVPYVIVGGRSSRGFAHVIVRRMSDGAEWDPHPSRAGLLTRKDYLWFEEGIQKDDRCNICRLTKEVRFGNE